ncbi:hypothetical protein LCER1_G008152, partial [Lachnellula cervina]
MATLDEACATCARYLNTITPQYDEKSEKPVAQGRTLDCCGRVICGNCIHISTTPSPLPQGLKDPPSYTPAASTSKDASLSTNPPAYSDELPTYSSIDTNTSTNPQCPTQEKQNTNTNTQPAED